MSTIAYLNGKYAPITELSVPIDTHALQYGTGCFEGIRGYWNGEAVNVLFLKEHFERLYRNSKMLMMNPPSVEEMCEIAISCIKQSGVSYNCYIRPMVFKLSNELSPEMLNPTDGYMCYIIPLEEFLDTSKGLSLCVSSWVRLNDNSIPTRAKATGGYINSALAKTEALSNGFDEAIFLNDNGQVAEGSAENIFLVRDGVLITPDKTAGILEGITRQSVIDLAKEEGIEVQERAIARTELYVADECFLVGTGCQISFVKQIDRRLIANGEKGKITSLLKDKYEAAVYDKDKSKSHWLTKV